MIDKFLRQLNRHVAESGIEFDTSYDKYLVYNNIGNGNTAIIVLLFRNQEKTPFLVVKISRREDLVSREFNAIKEIQSILPQIVPEPYFMTQIDSYYGMVVSYVQGKKISDGTPAKEEKTLKIVDLLVELHLRLYKGRSLNEDELKAFVIHQIDKLATLPSAERFVEPRTHLKKALQEMSGKKLLPRIPQHGDFCFNNLLIKEEQIVIIDWENYGQVCLPLYDLCTLFFAYREERFCLLPEDGATRSLFATSIRKYCSDFNLNRDSVHLLVPLFFIYFFFLRQSDNLACNSKSEENLLLEELRYYFQNQDSWIAQIFG